MRGVRAEETAAHAAQMLDGNQRRDGAARDCLRRTIYSVDDLRTVQGHWYAGGQQQHADNESAWKQHINDGAPKVHIEIAEMRVAAQTTCYRQQRTQTCP